MGCFFKSTKNVTESPLFNFNNKDLLKILKPSNPDAALIRYKGGGYLMLNACLREGGPLPQNLMEFALGLDKGLKNKPVYTGKTYRTMVFSTENEYNDFATKWGNEGSIVQNKAYTSASKDLNNLYSDPTQGKYGGALLRLNSKTGRDIDGIGLDESEVLFPRNTKFQVLHSMQRGNVFFIEADEV